MESEGRSVAEFRVARASRALAKASRQRELSKRVASNFVHLAGSDTAGKFVLAVRQIQRSGRACYPESAIRARRLHRVVALSARVEDDGELRDMTQRGELQSSPRL